MLFRVKHRIFISLIAGLIFSIGDMAHIYSGTAQYPNWQGPLLFNIPWWVPFEFAIAALLLFQINPPNLEKLKSPALLFSSSWTLLIYLGTSFLPESQPVLKSIVLFSAVAAQLIWTRTKSVRAFLEILVVVAGGCGMEYIFGKTEVFTYFPSPSLIGMLPVWLPTIYASVAITARSASST